MKDLAIIGGGPAGYSAAALAAKSGLSTVLYEEKELGGVCLNEGCIPTKTLLYSAKLYEHATLSGKYGVSAEGVTADFARIYARKDKVVKKLTGGVRVQMRDAGVEVVKARARLDGRADGGFRVTCGEDTEVFSRVLVCTGSSAAVPPIPGLAEAGEAVVTNREILTLAERPGRLVIIGGGVIGMEFASFFRSLGTEVTVVEMLPEILGGLDREIAAMLRAAYAKKGVVFHLGCRVTAIEGGTVVFADPSGAEQRVAGDRILLSVGRRPNLQDVGLESVGVEVKRGIVVDGHMRTSVPGIWAAGDVTGFSLLAHTAVREAEVAVHDMLGVTDAMRYDAIPGVVYTNPEVAGVGVTEEQADGLAVARLPMAYAGRFVAENERGEGLCKVLYDPQTRLVKGVHMIGGPCSEIIQGACIAITAGLTVDEIGRVVFPHPTVSEILKETVSKQCQ